ncbi:MAG: hypothetical protein ACLFUZ_02950 [Candidatus Micrarchaeia archaeon]
MGTEIANGDYGAVVNLVWDRFLELLSAPANEPEMLWFAVPLVFATIMMALYFGRYRKEQLGWNTVFENSMIFLFVSFDIFRRMYESGEPHSWANIFDNTLYLGITVGLAGVSFVSMILIYYHLLPKKVTFTLFARLPINIALYVIMSIVYAEVVADWITVGAGILLFLLVLILVWIIQWLQRKSAEKHDEDEHGTWKDGGEGNYELDEKDIENGPKSSLKMKTRGKKGKKNK